MTLIELLWTLGILAFVMSGIVAVFVSGLHSEFDMNQRFQAQQNARLALQSILDQVRHQRHGAPWLLQQLDHDMEFDAALVHHVVRPQRGWDSGPLRPLP